MEKIIWLPEMYEDGDESGIYEEPVYGGYIIKGAWGRGWPDGEYGWEELRRVTGPETLEEAERICTVLTDLVDVG